MEIAHIDRLVREAVSAASGVPVAALHPQTCILDLGLDSIGLLSVLTQVGCALNAEIAGEDTVVLFNAGSLGELVDLIAALIGSQPQSETCGVSA